MSAPQLIYDGDCPLCVQASHRLVAWGWVDEACRHAFQALPSQLQTRLLEAGFQNALAVLDGDETLMGWAGIDRLRAGARGSRSARLVGLPPLPWLTRRAYAAVAPNRRILAPVRRTARVACACEPVPTGRDRLRLLVPCVLLSLGAALLTGAVAGEPLLGLLGGGLILLATLAAAALPAGDRLGRMTEASWIVVLGLGAAAGTSLLLALVDLALPLEGTSRLAVAASVFVFVSGAALLRRLALMRA